MIAFLYSCCAVFAQARAGIKTIRTDDRPAEPARIRGLGGSAAYGAQTGYLHNHT